MKNITDYFASPPKTQNSSEVTPVEVEGQDENLCKNKPKSKRRKKHRKATDPDVKTVSELLDTQLNLISPNNNSGLQADSDSQSSSTPKTNVFDFMMAQRYSVIGSNEGGKIVEITNEITTNEEVEVKKQERKQMLENWAENKGASKRKRFDEEVEVCINVKLEKRAKRMKKLLNVEDNDVVTKKRKVIKKISSSESECSNVSECESELVSIAEIIDEVAREPTEFESPMKKVQQNGLLNFGALDDGAKGKPVETIKIKMFPPTTDKKNLKPNVENSKVTKHKKVMQLMHDESSQSQESMQSCIDQGKRRLRKRTAIKYYHDEDFIINKPRKVKTKPQDDTIEISSDDEKIETKKKTKVAPVFAKATPKPKVAPEVIEARRQFLMSGIPDSVKKAVATKKRFDERDLEVFPKVSHVQQRCSSPLWNLQSSEEDMTFSNSSNFTLQPCQQLLTNQTIDKFELKINAEKISNLKSCLQWIKSQNPDYPVFKAFRYISASSGKAFDVVRTSPKGTKKRVSIKEDISKEHEMWTEKYKPKYSQEIFGNYSSVQELRKWLDVWKNYSQEINSKRKKTGFGSESEFESTDCDSRDSTWLPGNTVIIHGPCGSGKTTAIYAIANELNFNVIELNASTKRTGKKLLQELQEATQSHQVRKNQNNLTTPKPEARKRLCIILIEDIDLIFDQDEGFLTSLSQLITTSKRPIILTTTDYSSPHVQKFMNQHQGIRFHALSSHCLSIWLQIVCLVEGIFVDKDDLSHLLEYNRGDIRKTLLDVQFYTLGGGQLNRNRIYQTSKVHELVVSRTFEDDQEVVINNEDKAESLPFVHKNLVQSLEVMAGSEEFVIPHSLDLGILWWNIPNVLSITNQAASRQQNVYRIEEHDEHIDLGSILSVYEAMILVDTLKVSKNSFEPVVRNFRNPVMDSLELCERFEHCSGTTDNLCEEINHFLLDKTIKKFNRERKCEGFINMALPDSNETRWRSNQHTCENFLSAAIPLLNSLERRSLALDYLPVLRQIARSEDQRVAANTKRGNRFRHYLKELQMDFKPAISKLACNVLHSSLDI